MDDVTADVTADITTSEAPADTSINDSDIVSDFPYDLDTSEGVDAPAETEPARNWTVKVGGEELSVSEQELVDGYQRQADYTRKTQELAQQRQQHEQAAALWAALERNPEQTLKILSESYGTSTQPAAATDEPEWVDPLEAKLAQLEQWKADQEQRQLQTQIESEYDRVRADYGQFGEFELADVLNYSMQHNIADVSAAYKAMAFDGVAAQLDAQKASDEQRAAAETAATDAKRAASVVSGGHTAASGAIAASNSFDSVTDAFRAAMSEHMR